MPYHCRTAPASLRYTLSSQPFFVFLSAAVLIHRALSLSPWDQFLHCSSGLLTESDIKRGIFVVISHLHSTYEHKIEGELVEKGSPRKESRGLQRRSPVGMRAAFSGDRCVPPCACLDCEPWGRGPVSWLRGAWDAIGYETKCHKSTPEVRMLSFSKFELKTSCYSSCVSPV